MANDKVNGSEAPSGSGVLTHLDDLLPEDDWKRLHEKLHDLAVQRVRNQAAAAHISA